MVSQSYSDVLSKYVNTDLDSAGNDTNHTIGAGRGDVPEGQNTVVLLHCLDRSIVTRTSHLAHQHRIHRH
jgi:hypothetical protein